MPSAVQTVQDWSLRCVRDRLFPDLCTEAQRANIFHVRFAATNYKTFSRSTVFNSSASNVFSLDVLNISIGISRPYVLTFPPSTLPTANPKTSFAPAFLPCLLMIWIQFETANVRRTTAFSATTATKDCHILGLLLLPLISLTFMP